MPDAGKHLVATLAARIFASQAVSDTAIVRHLTRDETEAEAAARRQSSRSARPSYLLDSWSASRALLR
jgi:hypothetical protein